MRGADVLDTASIFAFVGACQASPALGVVTGAILGGVALVRHVPELQELLLGEQVPDTRAARYFFKAPARELPAPKQQIVSALGETIRLDALPDTSLRERLQRLPLSVGTQNIGAWPASRTALPVGINERGRFVWLDLAADAPNAALHVGLYGQSGCGKDSLLRVWYTALCKRNSPSDVRFAIIDGKGDWLTSELAHQPHMFLPPAGGYGGAGDMRIKAMILHIDTEAARRQALITGADCRTREEYIRKTGRAMPVLVVAATDVMTNVKDDVENLLINLVSKARSLGIRVIVSMQTPSGKDTKWRMNLSTVIAGTLQAGSQDTPALGIETKDMRVRPSQLPSPQERPGVFVVKRGGEQHLVQAVYLPESRFDAICKTFQPTKKADEMDDSLLAGLLNERENTTKSFAEPRKVSQPVSSVSSHSDASFVNYEISLTPHETAKIITLILRNEKQTTIVKAMPGYRADRHKLFVAKYEELKALTTEVLPIDDEPDTGPFGSYIKGK